jgi:signal transduction histidine kinase
MTAAEFEKALDRDVRLDRDKDKAEGYGFGLAIAKELSERHDFKLYRAALRKNGTGIILEVPLRKKDL